MLRTVLALLAVLAPACRSPHPPAAAGSRPDTIAFNRGGTILLLDVATGRETVLVADNSYARPLHWLSSGERLVYWNHDGGAWDLWSVEPESGERRNLTRSASDARSAASSPDGRTVAFQRGGQGVWLMDADGGNERRVHERGHRDAPPAWSPSGRLLAFTDLESGPGDASALVVHVVEFEDDRVAGNRVAGARRIGGGEAQFFLDDRTLVVSTAHGGQRELVAVDLASGERSPLTASAARDDNAVLSPDRRRFAWVESGEEASRLMVMGADGSNARALAGS